MYGESEYCRADYTGASSTYIADETTQSIAKFKSHLNLSIPKKKKMKKSQPRERRERGNDNTNPEYEKKQRGRYMYVCSIENLSCHQSVAP